MHALYLTMVLVHVLAAALWVGGMGFFALVVVPTVKRTMPESDARRLLADAGARFAAVGWACFGTLLVTGVGALALRGLLPALATQAFWATPFGTTLAAKLGFVLVVFGLSAVHSRDARMVGGARSNVRIRWLGRLTLVASLAVVSLAIALVRGVPW